MRKFLSAFALLAAFVAAPLTLSAQQPTALKAEMLHVYDAFKKLQLFMLSEERFLAPENEAQIKALLQKLSDKFYEVKLANHPQSVEAGYNATLQVLSDMLRDSSMRFAEGRKEYSMWRLRTAANHCVSCHTRSEVKVNFYDADPGLDKLSSFDRANFYLATRQFDKASELFIAAARAPTPDHPRIEALEKWLIIYTRVQPSPVKAITELKSLAVKVKLTEHEREVMGEWLASLNRWKDESRAAVDPLAKAEILIRQGLSLNDPLSGKQGTVELLRASAQLHKILDENRAGAKRAHVLYLLGLTYSKLPLIFVNELPELFLEQCIREYPKTEEAKKSFRLYREIVTLGFTGSSGTHLPDDVLLIFKELHDLAYGVPSVEDRI